MADKVIDSLANRYVRSYDKDIITRLFSYRPYIKPFVDNCPWLHLEQWLMLGLIYRPIWKQPC